MLLTVTVLILQGPRREELTFLKSSEVPPWLPNDEAQSASVTSPYTRPSQPDLVCETNAGLAGAQPIIGAKESFKKPLQMSLCCINRAAASLLCWAMTTLSCVPKEKDSLPVFPRISNMTTLSQVHLCGLIHTHPSHTVLNTSHVLTAFSRKNVSASSLWCSDAPSLTGRLLSFPALAREQARRLPVNAAVCSARRAQGRVGAVILPGQVHSLGGGPPTPFPLLWG